MQQTMTKTDADFQATWRAASGHPGGWRVCRQFFAPWYVLPSHGGSLEEALWPSGRLRLFRSREAAEQAANILQLSYPAESTT